MHHLCAKFLNHRFFWQKIPDFQYLFILPHKNKEDWFFKERDVIELVRKDE